jgi:hypothetical protein
VFRYSVSWYLRNFSCVNFCIFKDEQAGGLVPLQQQEQHSNSAAVSGLQTDDNSAMQQHPQTLMHTTVYQQAGHSGQEVAWQMQSVCIYLAKLLAIVCTVNSSFMQINM